MDAGTRNRLLAMLCACSWMASLQPSMAQERVRAYALIETAQGAEVPEALGGLMNCKGLTTSLMSSEVIAHIECNDPKSLNEAITGRIPEIEGVLRTTIWSIKRIE
jgi:hypothetical protein